MPLRSAIRDFLRLEAAGGIVLFVAAVLAMFVANSPLSRFYDLLIATPVEIRIGAFELAKPLLLWINDGMMAVFFLMVGLELKREVLAGELSDRAKLSLPAFSAVGGMAVPAVIYVAINLGDPVALRGWAIPAATDIAFALGILSLLGARVPVALKVFLVSLAIFDDIGAIVVIALFYTSKLSIAGLLVAAGCCAVLLVLNRLRVTALTLYLIVGLVMWVAVLKSGVHATLAGVVLAQFIPMRDPSDPDRSPLRRLERDLHRTVAFVILPVFAFANAGISLSGVGVGYLLHPVPLGIAAGLFLGKQVGILAFAWIGVKLKLARLPEDVTWRHLYGAALLCGVGFTMSLFIGSLAFEGAETEMLFDERLGIIVGSLISGVAGYAFLSLALPRRAANP